MDAFPITFRHKRRLKDWDELSASNPPELSGLFTYACNPIVHWVVDDTLNRPRAGPVPPQYGDIITVRLRRMRSVKGRQIRFITFPSSLQKRWRSPLANPTTKRLISRLAQDTAVAAPLKGRSATNSFSPDATAQTTALESSPINYQQQKRTLVYKRDAPMLIKRLHPGLTAIWFTGLI